MNEPISTPGHDALHCYFGLSYAQYFVLPRSILQSMPDEWQGKFAELMIEMTNTTRKHDIQWPNGDNEEIQVRIMDTEFKHQVKDPLADYERGRRRLWTNQINATARGDNEGTV